MRSPYFDALYPAGDGDEAELRGDLSAVCDVCGTETQVYWHDTHWCTHCDTVARPLPALSADELEAEGLRAIPVIATDRCVHCGVGYHGRASHDRDCWTGKTAAAAIALALSAVQR